MKIDLNVRLKTYDYRDNFGEVRIIGDFNDFSSKSAKAMEKRPDGTYFAEFDTPANRFAYQLLGVAKSSGSINGTQSEDYVYDGGGDYRSVVTPKNGRVTVIFDPRALMRSEAVGWVRFKNANSSAARFMSIYEAMMARRDQLHDALVMYKKTGRPLNEFTYDWSADLADLAQKISKEKQPLLKQALLFSYLDLGYGTYGAKLDAAVARSALAEIGPTSPLWSIEPTLIGVAIGSIGEPQGYTSYVQEVIDHHSDPVVAKVVKGTLSSDRQIVVGKTVPAFSLAAFEQPGTVYTSGSLKGKIVLIDFWATWCVPCIEEMPNLHQEYEKLKGQGFEILSVSLDDKPEVVNEFRKAKWKMPWLHRLLSSNPEVKKQFEIVGIPKAVLIDRDGRIVATDRDLRGKKLHETLEKLLNPPH
jgi:thiol-disulfide isomerase/thioredoxin